jgi:hypothetical protein
VRSVFLIKTNEIDKCITEMRKAYKILVGEPKGKRPLGIPRCNWEDNIKIDLNKIW